MADQLLVRAYNVGCGDCIYVRIPGPNDGFHILIDCGKKGGDELLRTAIEHLAKELPPGKKPGKKRLDLIVATHRHEDHIKGFDKDWFQDIEVRNIWLSAAMDPTHPQGAEKTNELHAFATRTMRGLMDSGQALSPELELLAALYGVNNDQADELLMKTLPAANGIDPKYVHAGMDSQDLGLDLPPGTSIRILAPEIDIDRYYLGELAPIAVVPPPMSAPAPAPKNIGSVDFQVLQSRMLSNALGFVAKDSSIQNNLSVVLLVEWGTRRLLFVGDAEWAGEYREGKQNGSWNVMWEKRKDLLSEPVDFLKIGHHGSINATPPPSTERPKTKKEVMPGSVYEILDAILPVPTAPGTQPTAQAIVSTEREFYNPIPECKLLVEVARRVSNVRNYGAELQAKPIDPASIWNTPKAKKNKFYETYESAFLNHPQPLRTDLEFVLDGKPYVEVLLDS